MRTQNYMRFNELIEWSRQQDYIWRYALCEKGFVN
jgi:hypothetical protein